MAQKQDKLKDAIGATKDKLDILKTAQEQVERQFKEGPLGKDKHYALQQEIARTEAKLKDLAKEAANANSALTKIGDVGSAIQKAGNTMISAGKTLTTYVTAPILGLGTIAVKTGADFDETRKC